MKILVCGANGQVGSELVERARDFPVELIATGERELDIGNAAAIQRYVDDQRPDLLINAAAYTAVDKAEQDRERCFRVNRDASGLLADACARAGIPLFHISTDYVFDGRLDRPYRETDPPGPINTYGRSKWEGEQRVGERLERHLILRVAWVFGPHGNNFVKTIARLARERDELSIVADQLGSPTPASAIATTLLELASRLARDGDLAWGTYHYGGAPDCSWYDFATRIVAQLGDSSTRLNPIRTAAYPTPAARAANTRLDCSLIKETFGIKRPDWRSALLEPGLLADYSKV